MEEIKIIMSDQDEVITKGGLVEAISVFTNLIYKEEDFKKFYMQSVIPKERKDEFFYDFLPHYNLYTKCIIIPGAVETLRELVESGRYEVFIATDWMFPEIEDRCEWNIVDKHNFLIHTLGFSPRKLAFVGDKKIIAAHIRIDDRIGNLTNHLYVPEKRILFPAYHNMDLSEEYLESLNIERVKDWEEIGRKLLP